MTYEVQLAALKTDADTWDQTSSTLLTAEQQRLGPEPRGVRAVLGRRGGRV